MVRIFFFPENRGNVFCFDSSNSKCQIKWGIKWGRESSNLHLCRTRVIDKFVYSKLFPIISLYSTDFFLFFRFLEPMVYRKNIFTIRDKDKIYVHIILPKSHLQYFTGLLLSIRNFWLVDFFSQSKSSEHIW